METASEWKCSTYIQDAWKLQRGNPTLRSWRQGCELEASLTEERGEDTKASQNNDNSLYLKTTLGDLPYESELGCFCKGEEGL